MKIPGRPISVAVLPTLALFAAMLAAMPATAQDRASRRPQRPNVTLPDGPVRQVILHNCTACHGIDEYGYYAMEREAWAALIERMKTATSGAVQGTAISDADREILLDWLVAEFGPTAEPFERQYVVREVTDATRLTDAAALNLLTGACSGCHAPLEATIAAGLDEAGWRATLTGKIATGSALLIDEVDPLIDWLLRRQEF